MTSTQSQPAVSRVDWLAGNVFRSNPDGSVDIAIIPAASDSRSNGDAIIDPEANPTVLRFPSADAAADFARQLTQFTTRQEAPPCVAGDFVALRRRNGSKFSATVKSCTHVGRGPGWRITYRATGPGSYTNETAVYQTADVTVIEEA